MPEDRKTIKELQTLDINYLSKAKYEELLESSEIDPDALYITPDSDIEWEDIGGDIEDNQELVDYINEHGGKIQSISVNGVEQDIDSSGNVDINIKADFDVEAGNGITISDTSESKVISIDEWVNFDCGDSTHGVDNV